MDMQVFTPPELAGQRCTVTISDDAVHKLTHESYSADMATQLVGDLRTYANQLESGPLTTAPLLDAETVPATEGYSRVWHSQKYIAGPTLAELPGDKRVVATRQVLGEIASMPTIGRDRLAHPIDAWSGNFRVDPTGKAHFVDFMPPMVRRADNTFDTPDVPPFERQAISRQTLVMARLLQSVTTSTDPASDRVEAYDMLPEEVRGLQRDTLRVLTLANHLPYRLARRFSSVLFR